MRVLVADDDRVVVALLTKLLRGEGHEVIPVFDAMQAVMFGLRPPPPDLVVLDVNMPGGNGLEALRRLRASRKTALIPIIVLSGSVDPQMPEKVKALGADAFLPKPVDPAALSQVVARFAPRN
jgi:CheY-like chemotaxis protein